MEVDFDSRYGDTSSHKKRLPTFSEVLSRKTRPPLDLFNLYVFMQREGCEDVLDFWLDVQQHENLCRAYFKDVRKSGRTVREDWPEYWDYARRRGSIYGTVVGTFIDTDDDFNDSRRQLPSSDSGTDWIDTDAPGSSSWPWTELEPQSQADDDEYSPTPSVHFNRPSPSLTTRTRAPTIVPRASAITRIDLIASAERIFYRYLTPNLTEDSHEIYLPPSLRIHSFMVSSTTTRFSQNEAYLIAQIPDMFHPQKEYCFRAMEQDVFPRFLKAKASIFAPVTAFFTNISKRWSPARQKRTGRRERTNKITDFDDDSDDSAPSSLLEHINNATRSTILGSSLFDGNTFAPVDSVTGLSDTVSNIATSRSTASTPSNKPPEIGPTNTVNVRSTASTSSNKKPEICPTAAGPAEHQTITTNESILLSLQPFNVSDRLKTGKLCASGGSADVYKGELYVTKEDMGVDVGTNVGRFTSVAVKRFRIFPAVEKSVMKSFVREVRIWSDLKHPNVLPLLGFAVIDGLPSLISEWMDKGTLKNYLKKNPSAEILRVAIEIAEGLMYLHNLGIVHGDLKSDNVLLSPDEHPMLSDFGLSRLHIGDFTATGTTTLGGNARWMAIELIVTQDTTQHQFHTKESDVWAFGMVLFEILTGEIPYYHVRNEASVIHAITTSTKPMLPPTLPNSDNEKYLTLFKCVCFACWATDPRARPTMWWVLDDLRTGPSDPRRLKLFGVGGIMEWQTYTPR